MCMCGCVCSMVRVCARVQVGGNLVISREKRNSNGTTWTLKLPLSHTNIHTKIPRYWDGTLPYHELLQGNDRLAQKLGLVWPLRIPDANVQRCRTGKKMGTKISGRNGSILRFQLGWIFPKIFRLASWNVWGSIGDIQVSAEVSWPPLGPVETTFVHRNISRKSPRQTMDSGSILSGTQATVRVFCGRETGEFDFPLVVWVPVGENEKIPIGQPETQLEHYRSVS